MPFSSIPSPSAPQPASRCCLPVKAHLLQYVVWRERLPAADTPIPVPGLGPIAAALDMVRTFDHVYLGAAPREAVDHFTARLYYALDPSETRRFVADPGVILFNRFLDQLLRDDLFARILAGKSGGLQEKKVIEDFLTETRLDEFLDFESVKKAQWRLRVNRRVPTIRTGRLPQGRIPYRTGAAVQQEFDRGVIHW